MFDSEEGRRHRVRGGKGAVADGHSCVHGQNSRAHRMLDNHCDRVLGHPEEHDEREVAMRSPCGRELRASETGEVPPVTVVHVGREGQQEQGVPPCVGVSHPGAEETRVEHRAVAMATWRISGDSGPDPRSDGHSLLDIALLH